MSISNEDFIKKADFQLASLTTDGGELAPEKFKQIIDRAVTTQDFLSKVHVTSQTSTVDKISKMKFTGRVAHSVPNAGTALSLAQRSAPVMSEVEITTHKFMAECKMPNEVYEDNVEMEKLEAHLITYLGEHIGIDTQENVLHGITTSANPDLAVFNGLRAQVTTNTFDALSGALSIDMIGAAINLLADEFRSLSNLGFFTSDKLIMLYRMALAARATSAGDIYMLDKKEVTPLGYTLSPVHAWPTNLGIAANETDVILCDPENVIVSYKRKVTQKKVDLPREDSTSIVWSYRVGMALEEEEACVKIENVLCE